MNFAESLSGCLEDKDILALNNATVYVELLLDGHYGNSNSNENFYAFLTDLSSPGFISNFEKDFFINEFSVQLLYELEESGTFDKIWTLELPEEEDSIEIPIAVLPENEESKELDLSIYYIDPKGDYLKCLNEHSKNDKVIEILNSLSEGLSLSPNLIAGALKEAFNNNEVDDQLSKVVISMECYFSIVNLVDKNTR
ncbi:hypothetical protein [Aureitalea marina]|uniref:Uncharacterized protein n=1 Tax=Aureitalea marina TaxID=930804 RepID=A0A2S7KT33_9FLAO|nr:hypothetical protein [Aureitalea marina]PQB05766.1 hypothetical protein BST85_13335 [Aureitalea marina]PQB05782.1 hypothetical protein BST85_13420 [Aureitalea marina]